MFCQRMDSTKDQYFDSKGFVELLEQCGDAGSVEGEGFLYPSTTFRYYEGGDFMGFSSQSRNVPRSAVTGSDSSSTSSSCSGASFSQSTIQTKGNEVKSEQNTQASCDTSKQVFKKPKTKPSSKGVRKEKIGDRIAALQQLVSPFGKTDTASVLHEAMGYIKFLHDQVQVLSSPYMQSLPSASSTSGEKEEGEEERSSLRRRGLCLASVESTMQVASSNGADLWSPAMGNSNSSSSNI